MATVTINRIPAGALELSVVPPSFSQLTADALGNAATDTDGFDAALQDIALALASEPAGLSALDSDLGEAAFTIGEFAAGNLDPMLAEIGAAVSAGESVIGGLEGTIAGGGAQIVTPTAPELTEPNAVTVTPAPEPAPGPAPEPTPTPVPQPAPAQPPAQPPAPIAGSGAPPPLGGPPPLPELRGA